MDVANRVFYRAANSIFGKIGRTASEEVVLEFIRTKCIPILLYGSGLLGLGLGLGLGLEASGLGLGLVFLALALFKAKVKVTNIIPNTLYLGIITLTVH